MTGTRLAARPLEVGPVLRVDTTGPADGPAMLIHGTADTIAPIEGGFSRHLGPNGERRGRTLSLTETAEFWRAADVPGVRRRRGNLPLRPALAGARGRPTAGVAHGKKCVTS